MKSYEEFKKAIRMRESSDRYDCVNRFGYLGGYQFGMPRLCDLGLTRRIGRTGPLASRYEFIPPCTRDSFLASPSLQDDCFDRHVQDLKRRLLLWYSEGNISGAVAACHLLGYQAFVEYRRMGKDRKDGLGTSISEYYKQFEGYEIP